MRIKKIREDKGLSQKQLALKIGVKTPTISRYESGQISIDAKMLNKIAVALGVDVNMLFDNYEIGNLSISEMQIRIIENLLQQPKNNLQQILTFIENLKK